MKFYLIHPFRKLQIHICIKNNLVSGLVVLNVLWSQNRAIFVVFGPPDRLYSTKVPA
jgi:hypothetical protein